MAKSLLEGVSRSALHRVDVNFKIQEKNIDTFIGRAAHIEFLENHSLIKTIVYRFSDILC